MNKRNNTYNLSSDIKNNVKKAISEFQRIQKMKGAFTLNPYRWFTNWYKIDVIRSKADSHIISSKKIILKRLNKPNWNIRSVNENKFKNMLSNSNSFNSRDIKILENFGVFK